MRRPNHIELSRIQTGLVTYINASAHTTSSHQATGYGQHWLQFPVVTICLSRLMADTMPSSRPQAKHNGFLWSRKIYFLWDVASCMLNLSILLHWGTRYEPEGRGFDSRWTRFLPFYASYLMILSHLLLFPTSPSFHLKILFNHHFSAEKFIWRRMGWKCDREIWN
jgi:hypothetical protein